MKKMTFLLTAALIFSSTAVFAKDVRKPNQVTGDFDKLLVSGLSCKGTEPFWGIEVSQSKISYYDPVVDKKKIYKITHKLTPVGASTDWGVIVKSKQLAIATIRPSKCSDGMSEHNYPYEVTFLLNDSTVLMGCCEKK